MEDSQAPAGVDDSVENRAALISCRLAEGRELLERMQSASKEDFKRNQKYLLSHMELFKWMEEQQVAFSRDRASMENEVCALRSEVEQLRAVRNSPHQVFQVCDIDRFSEKIDLQALAERKWISGSRQPLAPVTPEAVKARTSSAKPGVGKENLFCGQKCADEIQRLCEEIDRWKQKASRLAKECKGWKSQYNYLQSRSSSKGDVGQLMLNPDHVRDALEASSGKPPKIRRRSHGDAPTQAGDSKSISSDVNAPSTPAILPRAVVEVVSGAVASTSDSRDAQVNVKAESDCSSGITRNPVTKGTTAGGLDAVVEGKPEQAADLPAMSTEKNKAARGLDARLEGKSDQAVDNSGTPTATAGSRKRYLEPSGRPAFKYVEPVRKKADRENLQGTECKLCKKFYDAVIDGNAQGGVQSRCNHLEKSRHRFRDLPPSTPEGFWNIGFDSEL